MISDNDEIEQFQLEKKLKEEKEEENQKKLAINNNFTILKDLLIVKTAALTNNKYSPSTPLARYYDQELVTHLDAIYNILKIMDERLNKLEER
jgi:hypothetical protein